MASHIGSVCKIADWYIDSVALVTGKLASFHLDNCFNTLLTGLDQSPLGLETALLPIKWIATFASVKNLVMGESFEHLWKLSSWSCFLGPNSWSALIQCSMPGLTSPFPCFRWPTALWCRILSPRINFTLCTTFAPSPTQRGTSSTLWRTSTRWLVATIPQRMNSIRWQMWKTSHLTSRQVSHIKKLNFVSSNINTSTFRLPRPRFFHSHQRNWSPALPGTIN